jgi:hypothetical protein
MLSVGARNGYVVRAGYRPRGDDDNLFQSVAIHESGAVVLMQVLQGNLRGNPPIFFV